MEDLFYVKKRILELHSVSSTTLPVNHKHVEERQARLRDSAHHKAAQSENRDLRTFESERELKQDAEFYEDFHRLA